MQRFAMATTGLALTSLFVGCGTTPTAPQPGESSGPAGELSAAPATAASYRATGASGRVFVARTQAKADAAAAIDRAQNGFITHHGGGPGGVNLYVEEGLNVTGSD